MKSIRIVAKANFLLSAVLFLSWVVYRLWRGLPINEGHTAHSLGPAWLGDFVGEGFFIYLFFFDTRISELFVRALGTIGAFGLLVVGVLTILQSHIYDSPPSSLAPLLSWYAWPSIVICALLGRRSLSESEMHRLSSILPGLFGGGQ